MCGNVGFLKIHTWKRNMDVIIRNSLKFRTWKSAPCVQQMQTYRDDVNFSNGMKISALLSLRK